MRLILNLTYLKIGNIENPSRILVASYIDNLLTTSMTLESCMDKFSKIMEILMSLVFVIHPSKSEFIPSKTTEYLGFVINTEDTAIRLTYAKKMLFFNMCTSLCSNNSCSIRDIAKLSLERAKVKNLKASKGNFDKTMVLDGQSKLHILWWQDNIMNSHSPIIQGDTPTHIYYTDASSYGWGASCNSETFGGQFSTTDKELHINLLELKAALCGMKSFYKEGSNQHI